MDEGYTTGGHCIGWPGLTAERVHKYLSPKIETDLGHMHKIKQGTKSTAVQPSEPLKKLASHDLHIQTIRTDTMEDTVTPERLKKLLATDLPGKYPVTLARVLNY